LNSPHSDWGVSPGRKYFLHTKLKGTLCLLFPDYRINPLLPDNIFKQATSDKRKGCSLKTHTTRDATCNPTLRSTDVIMHAPIHQTVHSTHNTTCNTRNYRTYENYTDTEQQTHTWIQDRQIAVAVCQTLPGQSYTTCNTDNTRIYRTYENYKQDSTFCCGGLMGIVSAVIGWRLRRPTGLSRRQTHWNCS
jgi:hypothetical protein